jgi:preprotein translocase subunit SecE
MVDSPENEADPAGGGADSTAVADRQSAAEARGPGGRRRPAGARPASKPNRGRPMKGRSLFDIYKRGQGAYTRGGTALGAGILILAGGNFVYEQLAVYVVDITAWTKWLQTGITLGLLVGLGLLTFWIVGVNRKACDFMIATEGEMKKVNWSSRREILGSTKVVIMFTILLAVILFVVDLVFMSFFSWIGVLREAPSLLKMFGVES